MLREHPYIQRARITESITERGVTQRLIVETDINLSQERNSADDKKLARLKSYLTNLAMNDFGDFSEIEIRPYGDQDDIESECAA
ncbi:MAG: hypothetical protein AAF569_05150 [Pseudomonadota bacterium]